MTCRKCPDPRDKGPVDLELSTSASARSTDIVRASAPSNSASRVASDSASLAEGLTASSSSNSALADSIGSVSRRDKSGSHAARSGSRLNKELLKEPKENILQLPVLSVSHFQEVEDLQMLPAGDRYLQPPVNFAAIDSIGIVGDTAYLFQIAQGRRHGINEGLLGVLACLPKRLTVKFFWVLRSARGKVRPSM